MYDYGYDNDEESMDDEENYTSESDKYQDAEEDENQETRISITDYLKKIVSASQTYRRIIYAEFGVKKIDQLLKDLKAIKSFPSYIYLMHFLQQDKIENKDKIKVLRMIGALMLRRHITSRRTSENDDIFANLLRIDFDNENYVSEIKSSLSEYYPDDEEFEDRFMTHELKERVIDRARYILTQIEYHLTGNTQELSIGNTEDVHVEHIIPKAIDTKKSKKEFGDWMNYLSGNVKLEHKKRVNRIGNMTLLSGVLNIKISNNPFLDKRQEYRNSNIQLTKDLGEYKYFKFQHLDDRGKELSSLAKNIWKL
jgi:hypothetical protein